MALQFRRGNEADFTSTNLKAGEPAFTLDSMKTFVGTGSGASELLNMARYATGNGSNANKVDHAIQADSATTQASTDNSTKIATTAMVQAAITAAITAAKLAVHPIGSKIFNEGTNPGTYIGGTWAQTAQGCFIAGVNTSDSDFSTSGKTGGEKTHALTVSELPSITVPDGTDIAYSTNNNGTSVGVVTNPTYYINAKVKSIGSGAAHNNLPPYQAMYVWTRTA